MLATLQLFKARALIDTHDSLKQTHDDLSLQLRTLTTSYDERGDQIDKLQGDINRLNRLTESQSRDLKKVLKDNAFKVSELEKALFNKTDECEVCYCFMSMCMIYNVLCILLL